METQNSMKVTEAVKKLLEQVGTSRGSMNVYVGTLNTNMIPSNSHDVIVLRTVCTMQQEYIDHLESRIMIIEKQLENAE